MNKINWLFLGTAIALIASNSNVYAYYAGNPYVGIGIGEGTNTIENNSESVLYSEDLGIIFLN